MADENTFYLAPDPTTPLPVVVWGTGNMGRAAIEHDHGKADS